MITNVDLSKIGDVFGIVNEGKREFLVENLYRKENILSKVEGRKIFVFADILELEEFAKDGNIDAFIRSLQHVVKARGRGAITSLAKELKMDRSNLSDILNGKVQPKISTTLKLINGLGYKIQLKTA